MEHRRPSQRRRGAGLSEQQIVSLIIAASLVLAGLALAAMVMLSAPATALVPTLAPSATGAALPVQPQATPAPPLAVPSEIACLQQNGGVELGENARVIDGGTLEVTVAGAARQVRYAGIRFSDQAALDEQAAGLIRSLAEGQPVLLVRGASEPDESARYIFAGNRFLNLELVQAGLARADIYAADTSCVNLLQLGEQQARADRTGVWQATPAPTATFVPMVTLDPTHLPPCDCLARPECGSFATRGEAQACYNACNDYNSRLDDDRDGLACEELPEE